MPLSPLTSLHFLLGNLRNVYQKSHSSQRLRHSAMQLLTGELIHPEAQEEILQLLQRRKARRKALMIKQFPESICSHVQPSAEYS